MSCDVGEVMESLENEQSITSPTSQLILQPFRCFTYVTTHSPTIPLFHLHHSSFSNPFCCFTYVTAHSPMFPSLYLCHSSFSNPFRCFLCHSSFSNLSVALPMSQFFLQPLPLLYLCHSSFSNPFCCFTYAIAHSPTLLLLLLRHKFFTWPMQDGAVRNHLVMIIHNSVSFRNQYVEINIYQVSSV